MVDIKKIALILAMIGLLTGTLTLPVAAQAAGQGSIPDTLAQYTDFTTLVRGLNSAEMGSLLYSKGPYTFFAPTNTAFDKFTPGTLSAVFNDKQKIGDILQYHIVPGKLSVSDLTNLRSIKTIDGRTLPVSVQNGYLTVGGARVITRGIDSTNGIIYPVDNVIIPATSSVSGVAPAGAPVAYAPQQYSSQQYAPPQATVNPPAAQPPAPRGGPGILGTLGIALIVIVLVGLLLLWLFMKFMRRIFRGPQPRRQPPVAGPPSRAEPGKGVYEPATFGSSTPHGGTIRDEGPYVATGGATTAPAGTPLAAGTGGITFDESAVIELKQMDKSRLAGLQQYIVGSYNNFKDMLDLVRDAHIDLQDIKDNNAVRRFMERYHLSPFNSNTLELALERNATIYTRDTTLMDIYRRAGAKSEDFRRLIAGR